MYIPTNEELIKEIADIAHCGGLQNMTESEALIAIRKLTIDYFDKGLSYENKD